MLDNVYDDEAVQATNDDASECKRCAVQLGYWQDPYINYFIKGGERKAPEINRGYYARVKGVGLLIDKFLEITSKNCQILNLGAGFDTLYWRLKDSGYKLTNYIEVDFQTVTARKCYLIKRNKQLLEKIHVEDGEIRLSATDLHGSNYHIVGVDLRNLKELESKLADSDFRYDVPTLVLAECVLVYMEPAASAGLIKFLADKVKNAIFINYEQVNMGDRFGEVMMKNLRSRGCLLSGATACESLKTQQDRFIQNHWSACLAYDMVSVYNSLPSSDRHRIEKLELLDEQELLTQLFQHYCITISIVGHMDLSTVDFT